MNFLLDNNLSIYLAHALGILSFPDGYLVKHLSEEFPNDIGDIPLLEELSDRRDWALVTIDRGIRRHPHERLAWKESNVPIFWLVKSWQHIEQWDFAWKLIRRWPKIVSRVKRSRGIVGYRVFVNRAKIEEIRP
ncbi:MAG: hypothetical protein IH972_02070 [Candidatus Marinimicrobia bacterium]|nr:hypothetical protein [Candidatus Neomarinimicrobiota bacterium]